MNKQEPIKGFAVLRNGEVVVYGNATYAIVGVEENAKLFGDECTTIPVTIMFD